MNKNGIVWLVPMVLLWAFFPQLVLAHDGDTVIRFGSYLGGLTHPVLGLDHFLAMVSVGILSAQIGGRAIWTVPLTFVAVMAVGGAVGIFDIGLGSTIIETGIALSVIILGGIILAGQNLPIGWAMVAVGFFALFHGYAHGTEMPAVAEPVLYALGFMTGSALIHVLGVFIGDIPQHYDIGKLLLRLGGGIIGVLGILIISGVL